MPEESEEFFVRRYSLKLMTEPFYVTQQTRLKDRHVYAIRSRFIPNELLHHFEEKRWPKAMVGGVEGLSSAPKINLKGRMRGMWD